MKNSEDKMKILFIGGTGNISRACTEEVIKFGHSVFHLNRGNRPEETPKGVTTLKADINDPSQVRAALGKMRFDCIVDWIVFNANDARRDLELFSGLTDQYVFISSTSVYKKPAPSLPMTESTPLGNAYWQYSRDKIAGEMVFMEAYNSRGFPVTIVRPSHTYGDGWIPTPFGSAEFTVARRILEGREVVVPGDGQTLWTLTHNTDFAKGLRGLLGNRRAIGEAFHITGDEILTWDAIYMTLGEALGVPPKIVHIPSDYIVQRFPDWEGNLLGDKSNSALFDNSKIKRFVPDFFCTVPFSVGIKSSVRRLQANPGKKVINAGTEDRLNTLVKEYSQLFPDTSSKVSIAI
jgi:nucleoside-diphosphate-sugar epimerase